MESQEAQGSRGLQAERAANTSTGEYGGVRIRGQQTGSSPEKVMTEQGAGFLKLMTIIT